MSLVTSAKKDKFLKALAQGASVTKAAQRAGFARQYAYELRDEDEEFAEAWDVAVEAGTDALEDEAVRRGKEGVRKPVYQGGKLAGYVREYSDTLLIFMLKGRRPETFKERVEQTHRGNIGIGVSAQRSDLSKLTDEELNAYEELLAKMQASDERNDEDSS